MAFGDLATGADILICKYMMLLMRISFKYLQDSNSHGILGHTGYYSIHIDDDIFIINVI
jgi:hypothetical protein